MIGFGVFPFRIALESRPSVSVQAVGRLAVDILDNNNSQISVALSEKGGMVRTEGCVSSKANAMAFKSSLEEANSVLEFYCWIDSAELMDHDPVSVCNPRANSSSQQVVDSSRGV